MTIIRTTSRADRHKMIDQDDGEGPHYPKANGAKIARYEAWTARHYYRALRRRDVSAFYARHVITSLLNTKAEFVPWDEFPTVETP